jgi:aminoglycoside 2'-N-acetyltransferase I
VTGAGEVDAKSIRLRRVRTPDLGAAEIAAIRDIVWGAFRAGDEGFTEDDWDHALGGMHFVLDVDGVVVAHASVVPREIHVDVRPLRAGYVEAVATAAPWQGRGLGTLVMSDVDAYLRDEFELGVLGTGAHHFYERLGWQPWRGEAFVRTPSGPLRTPDEEGYLLVLATPSTPELDLSATISCEWRPGDVW